MDFSEKLMYNFLVLVPSFYHMVMDYGGYMRVSYGTPSQYGAMAERRTRNREVSGLKPACAIWFFPWGRK